MKALLGDEKAWTPIWSCWEREWKLVEKWRVEKYRIPRIVILAVDQMEILETEFKYQTIFFYYSWYKWDGVSLGINFQILGNVQYAIWPSWNKTRSTKNGLHPPKGYDFFSSWKQALTQHSSSFCSTYCSTYCKSRKTCWIWQFWGNLL